MFQFHKVRLKDFKMKSSEQKMYEFQFHKVRLKGLHLDNLFLALQCFNSIRYD